MKPGDLLKIKSRIPDWVRGEVMGVILEETEYGFVVLFTNGKVDHARQAYFLNYYQVIS